MGDTVKHRKKSCSLGGKELQHRVRGKGEGEQKKENSCSLGREGTGISGRCGRDRS